MTVNGTIDLAPEHTNHSDPIRLEDLTPSQVTAIIVQLDDLRRDMRHTAASS